MRITIFGLTISSSWGNGHATPYRALLRALHRLGHSVTFYEKDVPYYANWGRRDFTSCDYCDLVLYSDWDGIHAQAMRHAREADVVVCASYCPEGAQIADEVLALRGPLRVYYDLDTPITLGKFARGEQVEYLRPDQVGGFDLVLSFVGGPILQELGSKFGAQMARPLYGSVDPDVYGRVEPRDDFRCDLSYMGTYAPDRQAKLESLFLQPAQRRSDSSFLLAGSMYPRELQWPVNVRRVDHLSPHDHPALYSSSAWTLNITRQEMAQWGWCPSGRFFEAAACGCPILTDSWNGLDHFFETTGTHRELGLVQSSADVLLALQMPAEERARMAAHARQRTLEQHTGMQRAQEFLAACEAASARDYKMEAAS
jgi:spore maturation protein CgeB